ncbi:protein-disulfide reductase DsbD domain-containing protein [Frigidibacter oleivorans]|uniref:protein-disulfide reductase DsbD domain-containing protein n=1 Tax=Frigidibacter oleivorans TaxID=2487129 RepID=UPI001F42EB2D|nr:protein-disulfide reductase DsbD domain-containing protein [Frigidibacter oleivorans]
MNRHRPSPFPRPLRRGPLALVLAALLAVPFGAGLFAPGPAMAQSVQPDQLVAARLMPGWDTGRGTHMAALRLDLAEGWKTYWRAPGDAGIPPQFDWSGSENVAAVRLHWPAPLMFELGGMRTFGYRRQLVLPVEVTPRDPSRPIALKGTVNLGICRDICVPLSLTIGGPLPAGGAPSEEIRAALAAQPRPGAEVGARTVQCRLDPIRDGLRLTAVLESRVPQDAVAVIETSDPSIWVSETETVRQGGQLISTADLLPGTRGPMALDRSGVTITLIGSTGAVELKGCPAN